MLHPVSTYKTQRIILKPQIQLLKKGNKENSNVIVIKRNSFSRATDRGGPGMAGIESANQQHHYMPQQHNATIVLASANPANRTSSMSRIFGTDISNIATNGVPMPGISPGLQQSVGDRIGCASATNKLISTRKLHQGALSMISTAAGNSSQ